MKPAWLAAAAFVLLGPGGVSGQAPDWLFPDRDLLPDLLAAPRSPVVKGQLVYADPNPTAYGPAVSGEVAVAGTLPVLLLAGSDDSDALVLGMEGAAFAHFSFAVVTRELVNTDWIFAVPLVWYRGDHWVRVRYYHTSSHLGDEYQRRFGRSSINYSRDGVDVTGYWSPEQPLARRLGLGLYAGALWSANSNPEARTVWRAGGGVEVDPWRRSLWRPYAAVDVEVEEDGEHGARWTAQLGLWLPAPNRRPLRLAVEAMAGPSAMGQFGRRETRRVGLGLYWNP